MPVTESMKALVDNKVKKLERIWSSFDPETIRLRVVLNSAPDQKFLVKLDLNLDGESYYTEEPGFELETALVDAIQEILRQYDKKKDRFQDKWEAQREDKYLTENELAAMSTQDDVYEDEEDDDDDLDTFSDME